MCEVNDKCNEITKECGYMSKYDYHRAYSPWSKLEFIETYKMKFIIIVRGDKDYKNSSRVYVFKSPHDIEGYFTGERVCLGAVWANTCRVDALIGTIKRCLDKQT